MTPLVSIVVPTRNRRAMLSRALASVDAQALRDVELIVVDDGSTDGTSEWLNSMRPDARLIRTAGAGAAAARNAGVRTARGELVAFLDDDDRWHPDYLSAQVENLTVNPEAAASYADHVEVDGTGRRRRPSTQSPLPETEPLLRLLAACFVHTMSALVCRRRAFERYGELDESLAVVHDLDWYARVLAGDGELVHLPRTLVERAVPGGLVADQHRWYAEEHAVIVRALACHPSTDRRRVETCRALYFAKIAFARGDVAFGGVRLGEALVHAPRLTTRLAARRVIGRRGWMPAEAAP